MPTTVDDVTAKTEMFEIDPKSGVASKMETLKEDKLSGTEEPMTANGDDGKEGNHKNKTKATAEEPKNEKIEEEKKAMDVKQPEGKKEEVPLQLEPKSGVSFPVKLDDGKQLTAAGLRKKSMFGMGIKVYGFGIYTDNEKLKDLLRAKIGKAPAKPTKEMYQMVIDSDVAMEVKMVIVYSHLTMSMVRKNFDEGLGAAIKKLTGGKNDELTKKIMGQAADDIKLAKDSVIEICRLPGHVLQATVMGEVVSKIESELLCRAYTYLYLGDDPFDKEAKEKFGMFLLSLF